MSRTVRGILSQTTLSSRAEIFTSGLGCEANPLGRRRLSVKWEVVDIESRFSKWRNDIRNLWALVLSASAPDTPARLPEADCVLISSDSNRSEVTVHGLKFDRHLDLLGMKATEAGLRVLSIGRPGSRHSGGDTFGGIVRVNRGYLLALIMDALSIFPQDSHRFRKKFWIRVWSQIRPKAVFVIGARTDYVQAANFLGIRIIEVLHSRGYRSTEGIFQPRQLLPQEMISFDAISSEFFTGLGRKAPKVWDTLDHWERAASGTDDFSQKVRSLFPQFVLPDGDKKKVILVSLEWGFAGEIETRSNYVLGVVPPSLDRAIQMSADSTYWLMRMHPTQWSTPSRFYRRQVREVVGRYESIENVSVLAASSLPLPSLMEASSGHVTVSSTATYQAAALGLSTLILEDPSRIEQLGANFYLAPAIHDGTAETCDGSTESILEWVSKAERVQRERANWGKGFEDILASL